MSDFKQRFTKLTDLDSRPNIKIPAYFAGLFAFILIFIFVLLGDKYVFGSYIDWNTQHAVIPDYFRQRFYQTGSLTGGDFAPELGNGQNPFYLAYHGMLNPVFLPSYLFPSVHMYDYVMISAVMLIFASAVICYLWQRGIGFSRRISFFGAFTLAFASPLIYHFHKHLMFVDYIPFLLLSFIGIDRMLVKKKYTLFIASFALSLMTSIFFAISMIISVTVYYFYRYIQLEKPFGKQFFRCTAVFFFSGVSSCLLTGVMLVPALYAIFSGRESNAYTTLPEFFKLFLPVGNFISRITYWGSGVGLGMIAIFALFALFFMKKKHTLFLAVSLSVISVFPIFNYAMNAFLYDHGKAFIPFLPLFLLVICLLVKNGRELSVPVPALTAFAALIILLAFLFKSELSALIITECAALTLLLILLMKKKFLLPLCAYSVILSIVICFVINYGSAGQYMYRSRYDALRSDIKTNLVLRNAHSVQPTRIADLTDLWYTCNNTYSKNLWRSSIYSSSSNVRYLRLMNNMLAIDNPSPHKIVISDADNIFISTVVGQRWIIGYEDTQMYNYNLIDSDGKWFLYRNGKAYSVGFSAYDLMSLGEFESLTPADRQFALTRYAVVDDDSIENKYSSPFTKIDISEQIPLEEFEGGYRINSEEDTSFRIKPERIQSKAILALNVKMDEMQYRHKNVTVNGSENTYSGYEGAFPNENRDMWFILSGNPDSIDISFSKGDYKVNEISLYSMDASEIDRSYERVTMAESVLYDGKNVITARAKLESDGVFLFTIPYDTGYKLYENGKEIPIEIIDDAFIGCRLKEGTYDLKLIYSPPMKYEGIITSAAGLALALALIFSRKIKELICRKKDVDV